MDQRDLIALIDRMLLEHGQWDPLECLILAGALSDEDYRRWRQGEIPELVAVLHPSTAKVTNTLQFAEKYLRRQGLQAQTETLHGWPPQNAPLRTGSARLDRLCSTRWRRPQDRIQRDLFQDSAAELAEQAIVALLVAGRIDDAQKQLAQSRQLADSTRSMLDELIAHSRSLPPEPAARLAWIAERIVPLAQRQLGPNARHFLSPLWRTLGEQLHGARFDACRPMLHASFAYAQAAAWRECAASVEAEPGWQTQAPLLARHATALQSLRRTDQARLSWSILCWMHAEAAPELLRSAADAALARRWREYQDSELDWPAQDFPAWLLLADPHQARAVPAAAAPGDPHGQAYAALHALLRADSIDNRRRLRDRHAGMLAVYLRRHRGSERRGDGA